MTPIKTSIVRVIVTLTSLFLLAGLAACAEPKGRPTCDKPKKYQSVVASKRIVVPEGLDPLDKFKEMPIPKAETPPRPEEAGCIENPPAIGKVGTANQ